MELEEGDILQRETIEAAVEGMDAVIHLVAVIRETEATFEEVNVGGVRNLLEACQASGVGRIVHMGALGTRSDSPSRYSRSKAEGEDLVKESGLHHTILRPALILGPGGDFTQRVGDLIRRSRKVPVIGSGENLLQPIYVGDVAKATVAALEERAGGRTWELGGPERVTWNDLVIRIAHVLGLRRSIRHVPPGLASFVSRAASLFTSEPMVTEDELILMQEDVYCGTEDFVELTGDRPLDLDLCLERAFLPPPG